MVEYSEDIAGQILLGFDPDDVKILLSLMAERSLKAGDVLFRQDEKGDSLFLVLNGRMAVQKSTGFGDRVHVVALLGPGAPIGEGALLKKNIHGATLVAVDDSLLLVLSRKSFTDLKKLNATLAVELLEWLLLRTSLRLRENSDRLSHVL